MAVSKERKAELIKQFGKDEKDSGSASVQVALLTERIKGLTEHVKFHKHDYHTRRGLLMLVGKRRNLLGYIKRQNVETYRSLIKSLGIRDNIQQLYKKHPLWVLFYRGPALLQWGRRR